MTGMISDVLRPTIHPMPLTRFDQWRQDRLIEARSILADATHHTDSLAILAARVISSHTDDPVEYAEATDLWRLFERGSFQTLRAADLRNGGAA